MPGGKRPGAGRPPGAPNKVTKQLKELILGALDDAGGQQYLELQARKNPAALLQLVGKVLPTTPAGDAGGVPITLNLGVRRVNNDDLI